jgi:hypothetical protein
LFAPPHGLSQRTTSFIASQRQGIHRIPLRHLIALIIDAHLFAHILVRKVLQLFGNMRSRQRPHDLHHAMGSIERPFASNMPENIAVKQMLTNWQPVFSNVDEAKPPARMQMTQLPLDKRSDMFPLHDDRQHRSRRQARDHEFGSSKEPRAMRRQSDRLRSNRLVEPDGIEPTTSCLQSTRSPN